MKRRLLKKKLDRKEKQKSVRDKKNSKGSNREKKLTKRNVLNSLKPKGEDFKRRSSDAKIRK